jgi:hypothetical protein
MKQRKKTKLSVLFEMTTKMEECTWYYDSISGERSEEFSLKLELFHQKRYRWSMLLGVVFLLLVFGMPD